MVLISQIRRRWRLGDFPATASAVCPTFHAAPPSLNLSRPKVASIILNYFPSFARCLEFSHFVGGGVSHVLASVGLRSSTLCLFLLLSRFSPEDERFQSQYSDMRRFIS